MDCDDCVCDCGPGDCDCACCGACCGACCQVTDDCCGSCLEAGCQETNCCGSCSRSTKSCCCCFITALFAIAVATLIAVLIVAFAVVFPARITVEDAYLGRLALTNGTALEYQVSLSIAVRNRNFAKGVWKTAPLDVELRFRGQTFARASAKLHSAEWGLFKARGKGTYRVTASSADAGAPAVALGGDRLAEFVRESVAGVFELELSVIGGEFKDEEHHGKDSSVSATCPLKLSLPTATAQVEFTRVKCTS